MPQLSTIEPTCLYFWWSKDWIHPFLPHCQGSPQMEGNILGISLGWQWRVQIPYIQRIPQKFLCLLQTHQPNTNSKQSVDFAQGKRTVEEYLAEFRLLTSLAGMTSDTPSDNIHLINKAWTQLSLRRSPFLITCPPQLLNGLIELSSMTQTTDSQWPC